jgi:hypothetical protein
MKKLLFIPLLLLIIHGELKADEFRYRTKFQNSDFIIELKDAYWILSSLKTKDERYSIKDQGFGTMSILISDDGEKIVVIDDFSVGIETDNRTVIWLYNNGDLIKSHTLSEMIEDMCNLSISVSHISWCLSDFTLDADNNVFTFSTNEMYNFKIDLSTGGVEKCRPHGYTEETIIAYGKIQRLEGKKYRIHIIRVLSSQDEGIESFDYTTNNIGFENSIRLIAIEKGVEITPQKYLFETIWIQKCND